LLCKAAEFGNPVIAIAMVIQAGPAPVIEGLAFSLIVELLFAWNLHFASRIFQHSKNEL